MSGEAARPRPNIPPFVESAQPGGGILEGRIAFITGGARGIGWAIAERFVEEGASVAVADVDAVAAETASARLGGMRSGSAVAVEADVTDEASMERAVAQTVKAFGGVDVVVVNAGILALDRAVDMRIDLWRRVVDVNLTGSFITARVLARQLLSQGRGGRIIFTGSLMARRGAPENAAYSSSMFALMGLMETMALELASAQITVNAVNPGQVQTEMLERLFVDRARLNGITPDEVRRGVVNHVPLGRLASTREVADAYVFLASHLAGYITGQALLVDGGWVLP